MERDIANASRFVHDGAGHYESWFQRGNHPERPLAFWIRYTIFAPQGDRDSATGELWAIYFDGERNHIHAAKQRVELDRCSFDAAGLDVRIGDATLRPASCRGQVRLRPHELRWDLSFDAPEPPLLLLPERWYGGGFPKAKALVGAPGVTWRGHIEVDGQRIDVDGWRGSQNHNWGSEHTSRYAWGQVAGFDGHPGSFLELSTAQVKIGPLHTPPMTLIVLRHDGQELRLNHLRRAALHRGRYDFFRWDFDARRRGLRIHGSLEAPRERFIALSYANPPGGHKTCLNTKLARCELTVELPGRPAQRLVSSHGAAFEILTDRSDHRVPVLSAP